MTAPAMLSLAALAAGVLLLVPIIFEYSFRRARFLYFSFAYKMEQHLFPTRMMNPLILEGYLVENEYTLRIETGEGLLHSIASRQNAIRQLTGEGIGGHLRALAEAGRLVSDIAESNRVGLIPTINPKPISPEYIISTLLQLFEIDGGEITTADELAEVMRKAPVHIEQLVELLLALVDLLVGRIEAGGGAGAPRQ